jgi:hypothetical protein
MKEGAMQFPHTAHDWFTLVERSALRVVMVTIGLVLMVAGLGLGVRVKSPVTWYARPHAPFASATSGDFCWSGNVIG